MNKNNKKTMNERTHNPLEIYKKDKNSNSNNNSPDNMNGEFGAEFGSNSTNGKKSQLPNKNKS